MASVMGEQPLFYPRGLRQAAWSFQGHRASRTTLGKTFDHVTAFKLEMRCGHSLWSPALE
jgi:hypothetical protein